MFVAEHADSFLDVRQGDRLRRRHYDGPFHRDVVDQGDVDVSGSRRHIHEEEVKLSPAHLQDHLLEGVASHRTSPDKSLFRIGEIADRHPFHTVFLDREEYFLVFRNLLGSRYFLLGAGHKGNRRSINIGVCEAHFVSEPGEGDRQVDGHGGFTHTALAGCYSDDMADVAYLFHSEVEARFLLRSFILLDYRLDFDLGPFRRIADYRSPGGSDEIFSQRIPFLREGQGDGNQVSIHRDGVHQSQFDYTLALTGGMDHLEEHIHNVPFAHYLTIFISLRR